MPLLTRPAATVRWVVLATVMLSMAMVAFEATIVATAMPQIVADLGGLSLYSWVFSSYLLTQTALTVVFGKLADLYGRKPVALIGVGIFVLGSILAGYAWSMPSLIVFRLIQGIGAGALQPAAMTIVADLYPGAQRGKIQGYLASVWAVSAVVGPLLGGLIVHNFSWSWVFWINIPVGALAAIGYTVFLHEEARHRQGSVDILGAVLAAGGIGALMVLLTEATTAGVTFELVAAAIFVICAVGFVWQERRAKDPMISFAMWRHRPILTANGLTLLASMALMGLTTFLPIYVQGVLGQSALIAGFTLTVMMIGWPLGATFAARSNHRIGARPLMIAGSVVLPIGAAILAVMGDGGSPIQAAIASLIMGLGMGLMTVTSLLLIQGSVAEHERGSGTASNIFSRNLGSTLGAAVLGAVLNLALANAPGGVTGDQLRDLLANAGNVTIADSAVRDALAGGLHITFIAVFVLALGCVFIAFMVPRTGLAGARRPEPAADALVEDSVSPTAMR